METPDNGTIMASTNATGKSKTHSPKRQKRTTPRDWALDCKQSTPPMTPIPTTRTRPAQRTTPPNALLYARRTKHAAKRHPSSTAHPGPHTKPRPNTNSNPERLARQALLGNKNQCAHPNRKNKQHEAQHILTEDPRRIHNTR